MDFIDHRSTAKFIFKTSATDEKARIDDSGNILTGKTSSNFSTAGAEVRNVGNIWATRDGGVPLALNRLNSDGTIAQFYKDGGSIGVVAAVSGDLAIYSSASGHSGLRLGNGYVASTNNAGTIQNGSISLGLDSYRWEHLWLSGDANIGGNATITGDLTVNGTTTTLNTATLDVEDKNITLNYGAGDTSASADGAGITIQDAVDASNNATILWDATNDEFDFSHGVNITGGLLTSSSVAFGNSTLDPDAYGSYAGGFGTIADGSGWVARGLFVHGGGTGDAAAIGHNGSALYFGIQNNLSNGSMATWLTVQPNKQTTFAAAATFASTITFAGGTTSANLNFGDNDKAIFGASGDLQIYHDGSNSYISDQGTGNLLLETAGDSVRLVKSPFENMLVANVDGAVQLYYDNSLKLATTSTGIDVTGNVTIPTGNKIAFDTDGLTYITEDQDERLRVWVANTEFIRMTNTTTDEMRLLPYGGNLFSGGNLDVTGSVVADGLTISSATANVADLRRANNIGAGQVLLGNSDGHVRLSGTNGSFDVFNSGNTAQRFGVANNGDISFYDSAGSSQSLFWDASTKFLGLGSTTPQAKLDIVDTASDVQMRVYKNDGTKNTRITVTADDSGAKIHYRDADNAGALRFNNNLGEVMRITADTTRVGIGTSSPSVPLTVATSTSGWTAYLDNNATSGSKSGLLIDAGSTSSDFAMYVRNAAADSDLFAIKGNGNVGIGTSSPIYTAASRTTTTINGASTANLSFGIGGTGYANLYVDASNVEFGSQTSANPVKFTVGGSEKARLDASGNLLVGKTDTTGNVAGISLRSTGLIVGTVSGGTVGYFNRTTSDGTILDVRKDNAAVGSIGYNSFYYIAGGASGGTHAGLRFVNNQAIRPCDASGDNLDNALDLGASTARFKDLYLSGTAYVATSVGIGTSSPSSFDAAGDNLVVGTGSGNNGITVYSGTANASSLFFADGTGSAAAKADGYIQYTHSNQALAFATGGGSERMRISSSGDVGLYDGQYINWRFAPNSTYRGGIRCDSSANMSFETGSSGSERMRIDANGLVGIGLTSPSSYYASELVVNAGGEGGLTLVGATTHENYLMFADGTTGTDRYSGYLSYNHGSNFMRFATNGGTEQMRIDSAGRVGIGTSDPSSGTSTYYDDLVIKNDTSGTGAGITIQSNTTNGFGAIEFRKADGTQVGKMYASSANGQLAFETGGSERMRIASGGNVGIGTSPTAVSNYKVLHVQSSHASAGGYIRLQTNAAAEYADIYNFNDSLYKDANTQIFRNKGGSTEYMRLDSSGNLLVGKTATTFSTEGIVAFSSADSNGSRVNITNDGGEALNLNRKTNDGNIAIFYKDGTTVGSIASVGGNRLAIGTGDVGLFFDSVGDELEPWSITAGSVRDAAINIGRNGGRFKDLHLSGNVIAEQIQLYDSTGNDRQALIFDASDNLQIATGTSTGSRGITFLTENTERMRLNAGGNLLVGKTSLNDNLAGFQTSPSGETRITRSGGLTLALNRKTSDGEILSFRKDGTTVGSIGTEGGDLTIGNADTGLQFVNTSQIIRPQNLTTNSAIDAQVDLGQSAYRFKDLYLSGAITAGGGISATPVVMSLATNNSNCDVTMQSANSGSVTRLRNGTNDFQIHTNGSERMRIDASGNVGIGTAPDQISSNATTLNIKALVDSKGGALLLESSGETVRSYMYPNSSGTQFGTLSNHALQFMTNTTERARIDTSGNLLLGKTSADNTTQGIRFLGSSGFMSVVRSSNTLAVFNRIDSDGTLINFRTNGTTRGSISISGSTTSYNTTSDQRAKENIVDAPSASDDIDAIKVRSFDFKADGSHQKYGMVAQELSTVAPEAVSVPDDAEEMQSVDYSKLVPMMLKEIQTLRARVAQLEGEN